MPNSRGKDTEHFPYESIDGGDCCNNGLEKSSIYGMNIRIDEDDETSLHGFAIWCGQRFFTREKIKRKFPISVWLPQYSIRSNLLNDIIAGISVSFTLIPQALALATLAGLTPNYGLYSAFMGCFVYTLLGCCPASSVGPTSIVAICVAPYVLVGGATYAILLSFFSGLMMAVLGLLNLGFMIDFISYPVISSFSTSSAITIACSQLKGFFGLSYKVTGVIHPIIAVFKNFSLIKLPDFFMGLISLTFLLVIQGLSSFRFHTPSATSSTRLVRFLNGCWIMFVTGRNAMVVIICSFMAHALKDSFHFSLTGNITQGLPPFELPEFELISNGTVVTDFGTVMQDISGGIVVLVVVQLMETVSIAKIFMPGKKLDNSQEMVAIGMCNFMGSFVSAFPVTGSFSRSAVNYASGVKTPLGGIVTGAISLLGLYTLGSYFEVIPNTALSAIIIAAVFPMIKFADIWCIWQSNKVDLIPYFATLLVCIGFGLEFGIVVGVNISLGILLYQMARPKISVVLRMTPEGHSFLYVKPDRSVFFPSIEYMKVKLNKALDQVETDSQNNQCRIIVIDGEHMFRADSTFGTGSQTLVDGLKHRGILLIFYNVRKPVLRTLRAACQQQDKILICRSELEVYAHINTFCCERVTLDPSIQKSEISNEDATSSPISRKRDWISQSDDLV